MGTCTAPRSPLSRLARVSLAACRGAVLPRSYARRWRGSRYVSRSGVVGAVLPRRDRASKAVTVPAQAPFPGPGVVGDAVPAPAAPAKLSRRLLPGPAPLHAVRVQQGDAPSLRSVTLPAWPLPAFRSAAWSVVPPLRAGDGPPLPLSRVQASSPVAPGLSCRVRRKSTRHAKPSAPRLRARLDAGLGKVRRWAAPLVLGTLAACLRFRRPPGGGRRASGLDARTLGGGLALIARFPCSEHSPAASLLPPPAGPPSAVMPS